MTPAIETQGLVKRFGAFTVTNDVNLSVAAGARQAIIGPNGAGKTTLINLLTGFLPPSAGQIRLNGADITRLAQHQRVECGLVRTFQINRLFNDLTLFESVLLATNERFGLGGVFWQRRSACRDSIAEAWRIVELLGLTEVANVQTKELSYGRQRLLEIALALAAKPAVLLLDEPAAGVPAEESGELFRTISALPRDVTVLLIEHDMQLVFGFADRITVLVNGAILTEGTPGEIANDRRVKEVYLGEALVV